MLLMIFYRADPLCVMARIVNNVFFFFFMILRFLQSAALRRDGGSAMFTLRRAKRKFGKTSRLALFILSRRVSYSAEISSPARTERIMELISACYQPWRSIFAIIRADRAALRACCPYAAMTARKKNKRNETGKLKREFFQSARPSFNPLKNHRLKKF